MTTVVEPDGGWAAEVWNDFSQRWTPGFVVVERAIDGYVIRRTGDSVSLPAVIAAHRVRPVFVAAPHPQGGDERVTVCRPDTTSTANWVASRKVSEEFTSCSNVSRQTATSAS